MTGRRVAMAVVTLLAAGSGLLAGVSVAAGAADRGSRTAAGVSARDTAPTLGLSTRRARGLTSPNPGRARRHMVLARRAGTRAGRAETVAGNMLALARKLGDSPGGRRFRRLAQAKKNTASRQRAVQRYHLRGATLDLSVPTGATCTAPPAPSPYSAYTLPAWSDIAGWASSPVYYQTIQTADLTGDGTGEVLGRDSSGVQIAQMQAQTGTFSTLPSGPPLSDAAGWNTAATAQTIHAGDIDGDGAAEIVTLTPGGQLQTWDGTAATGQWTALPASSAPAWNSGGTDWTQQTHWGTLQLADLDGNGDMELVARASAGIVAADFTPGATPGTGQWTALGTNGLGPPLSDADGWNTPPTSLTLQIGDVDGAPGAELVILDAATPIPNVHTWSFSPSTGNWTALGTGPAWTAAQSGSTNWADPAYYSTFGLADLDGDGMDEIVARSAAGLVAADWNPTTAAWTPAAPGAATPSDVLPDSQGWSDPAFYGSMRTGDFDGDGADEVFILSGESLNVVSYDAAQAQSPWTMTSSQPLLPSSWQQPQNYLAFTVGNVDGDVAEELVGRDQFGVRTFSYQNGQFVFNVAPFPVFTGKQCAAYNAIVTANLPVLTPAGLTDLRAAYGSAAVDLNLLTVPSKTPSGVSKTAYKAVAKQITSEIAAAIAVETWHTGDNGMESVIEQGFSTQVGSIGKVTSYFQPKPSSTVSGYFLSIIQGIVEAVGIVTTPEGAIAGELVATGINSVLGSAWNAFASSGQTQFNLNETEDQLQGYVSLMQQNAINGNTTNAAYIPREYGLMIALQDSPLPAGTDPWQGMWRASDLYFWQTYANAFWDVGYCTPQYGFVFPTPCNQINQVFTAGWGFVDSGGNPWGYWIGGEDSQPSSFLTAPKGSGYPPAYQVILGTPAPQCTPPFSSQTAYTDACALGVPPSQFYLGQDGWAMPAKKHSG